jgi:hypothetical protein
VSSKHAQHPSIPLISRISADHNTIVEVKICPLAQPQAHAAPRIVPSPSLGVYALCPCPCAPGPCPVPLPSRLQLQFCVALCFAPVLRPSPVPQVPGPRLCAPALCPVPCALCPVLCPCAPVPQPCALWLLPQVSCMWLYPYRSSIYPLSNTSFTLLGTHLCYNDRAFQEKMSRTKPGSVEEQGHSRPLTPLLGEELSTTKDYRADTDRAPVARWRGIQQHRSHPSC